MSSLLGFSISVWDWITFAVLMTLVISGLSALLFLAALPGRIAESRNHPEAEAVKIMGYSGFLAVVPWINAFIWAFKPTDVVDIRYMPTAFSFDNKQETAAQPGEAPQTAQAEPTGQAPRTPSENGGADQPGTSGKEV